jgi:hypothetical protein
MSDVLTDLLLSITVSVPTSRRPIELGSMLCFSSSDATAVNAIELMSSLASTNDIVVWPRPGRVLARARIVELLQCTLIHKATWNVRFHLGDASTLGHQKQQVCDEEKKKKEKNRFRELRSRSHVHVSMVTAAVAKHLLRHMFV